MILNIKHQTNYNFYSCVPRLVQSLKLYPSNCKNQKVINWNIRTSIGQLTKSHQDALGHTIYNIYNESLIGEQTIISEGKIDTKDFNGVMHGLVDKVNPLCFLRFTHLTKPGEKLIKLSKKIKKKNDQIKFCHDLNRIVSEALDFKTSITNNQTTAEEALKIEKGVCQDYAHILISLSKIFNIPSRYVNGYLMDDNNISNYSSHAWVEMYINDLGWVAFDPSHKKCIDQNYVRISCGYDFIDASPIKGVKLNYPGGEDLNFKLDINIEQ